MIAAQLTRPQIVRRTAIGILAFAAIVAGGIGSSSPVSADSASGYVSIGARMCALPTSDPVNECGVASVGALSLVEIGGGSQVLAMDEASYAGDNLVWGDLADVPLTSYTLDTQYLDVPSGFQVAELIPVTGDAGYGADGYYVALTNASPSVEAYIIYRPAAGLDSDNDGLNDLAEITIGTDPYVADIPGSDSDGDGASDAAEAAFGSDPYDASDFPAVQAGPSDDNGNGINDDEEDMNGDGMADVIATSLPNTGTGADSDDDLTEELLLAMLASGVAALVGGVAITQRG